jgi:chromosomal replication initiation ATPase DnaA
MAKITEEQLKSISKSQKELMTIVNQIGVLETQKHGLLHQVADANKVVEDLKAELEKEYGAIDIDLTTGEYTEVKKDDSKLTKA